MRKMIGSTKKHHHLLFLPTGHRSSTVRYNRAGTSLPSSPTCELRGSEEEIKCGCKGVQVPWHDSPPLSLTPPRTKLGVVRPPSAYMYVSRLEFWSRQIHRNQWCLFFLARQLHLFVSGYTSASCTHLVKSPEGLCLRCCSHASTLAPPIQSRTLRREEMKGSQRDNNGSHRVLQTALYPQERNCTNWLSLSSV